MTEQPGSCKLVGRSRAIEAILSMLSKIAPTPAPVLIEGETGTGKEVFARLLHERSGRTGPFVSVNMGALPPTLIESELFGHERGAFTSAVTRKKGRFELAAGGTILLDEIGELPLDMQVKLLRVLQESEIERVGGGDTIKLDVRVLAATNRNLKREIERRTFREDLYYRLAIVKVRMPPLRERESDAVLLAEHFARCEKGEGNFSLPSQDVEVLRTYAWPGNVRQLQSVIRRACMLSGGRELDVAKALDEELIDTPNSADGGSLRRPLDIDSLRCLARETNGNISEIARRLTVDRDRVKRALRRNRIDINQFRPGRLSSSYADLELGSAAGKAAATPHSPELMTEGERYFQPPGAPYDPAWYISRPEQECAALCYLATAGTPVVLWAPRRFGKTTLCQHLLRTLSQRRPATRIVELDLHAFSVETCGTLDALLREMGTRILEQLEYPMEWLEAAWSRPSDCKGRLSWLFEHRVLPADGAPLVLSIDRTDSLISHFYLSDFFALLRAWAEAGGKRSWSQLRIMLMISTMPSALAPDPHQSPFNLTAPIYLNDLTPAQVGVLSRLYGLAWDERDLEQLMSWLGGHPYLIRLAMHHAARSNLSLEPIFDEHSLHSRIFDDYLQECRRLLGRMPDLLLALSEIANNQGASITRTQYYALHRAGLVEQCGPSSYRLRCRLFENLL